jgi:hypothetical protein
MHMHATLSTDDWHTTKKEEGRKGTKWEAITRARKERMQ